MFSVYYYSMRDQFQLMHHFWPINGPDEAHSKDEGPITRFNAQAEFCNHLLSRISVFISFINVSLFFSEPHINVLSYIIYINYSSRDITFI